MFVHESVLAEEVSSFLGEGLSDGAKSVMLDGTIGGGGHSARMLMNHSQLLLVGVDQDPSAVDASRKRLAEWSDRAWILQGNFSEAPSLFNGLPDKAAAKLATTQFPRCDRVLLDLGVSSHQFDSPERGFSFSADAPLDMRMSQQGRTAADILNESTEGELRRIFLIGGVEHARAVKLAPEIIHSRPLSTTKEFSELCVRTSKKWSRERAKKDLRSQHPATVPFQALRMAVNQELDSIKRFLEATPDLVASGGIVAVISFHSIEDREVTRTMRSWGMHEHAPKALGGGVVTPRKGVLLTKKAIEPSAEECRKNPRARSAKLRVFKFD